MRCHPNERLCTATEVPPNNWNWPERDEQIAEVFPPEHIREFNEKSLANL